jgi:hypothetical protein
MNLKAINTHLSYYHKLGIAKKKQLNIKKTGLGRLTRTERKKIAMENEKTGKFMSLFFVKNKEGKSIFDITMEHVNSSTKSKIKRESTEKYQVARLTIFTNVILQMISSAKGVDEKCLFVSTAKLYAYTAKTFGLKANDHIKKTKSPALPDDDELFFSNDTQSTSELMIWDADKNQNTTIGLLRRIYSELEKHNKHLNRKLAWQFHYEGTSLVAANTLLHNRPDSNFDFTISKYKEWHRQFRNP